MSFGRTLLLVDNQPTPRLELRDILRSAGHQIVGEATTTDDALDKFEELQPDAVIMDVTLPGMTDPLIAIQRMQRRNGDVVIIATGTASESAVVMEALSMGATDFFLKPFKGSAVRSCLDRNLL